MGKIILRPKKSVSTIGGYDIDYPACLNGVLTLKEWDMLITIINQNIIRHYVSLWLAVSFTFIFFGLLFFLIIFIANIIRWQIFKSKAEEDLKQVLSSLNSQLSVKGVKIDYCRTQATFTLEITYPDHLTKPVLMNRFYNKYSFKPILLDTYAGSIPLVNPDIFKQPYHPQDSRLRSLLIASKCTSQAHLGWEGFETKKTSFPFALYNYLTPSEYKAILEDYNSVLISTMESSSWKFFLASCILCVVLIGVILLIPAIIWLQVSRGKYRKEWDEKLQRLNNKYSHLYASRGLSFHFYSTRNDLPRGFLNIYAPLDCGNAPTFTRMDKKQVICATVPGMLEPLYIPNVQAIQTVPGPQQCINSEFIDNTQTGLPTSDIDIDTPNDENTPLIG